MSKRCNFTALLLSFLLLALPFSSAVQAANKAQSQKELKSVERQLKALQADLKGQRAKRSKDEKKLQQADQQIAILSKNLDSINKDMSSLKGNLNQYVAKQSRIAAQISALRSTLDEVIRQRYKMGAQAPLKLLLNQSDPQKIQRMMIYFDRIRIEQQAKITEFEQLLTFQNQNNADVDGARAQLVKRRVALEQQHKKMQQLRIQRSQALKVRDTKINKNKTKINKLAADRKRLQSVLSRIEKIIPINKGVKDTRRFSTLKGKLPWPVKGKVRRRFGSSENGISYDGMLISASQGKAVKAVHSGHVVFADWLRSYGMVIIIDHGGGYLTLYGHNERLLKKVGDPVNAREHVALAGNSGGNTRTGLYFAIRYKGKTTNPKAWLQGK